MSVVIWARGHEEAESDRSVVVESGERCLDVLWASCLTTILPDGRTIARSGTQNPMIQGTREVIPANGLALYFVGLKGE